MTKVRFRGYNRVKFQSLKLGKTIFCPSLLLRDYLIYLEWDASVSTYELKPFKITYKIEGKKRFFNPHLLVGRHEGQSIVVWLNSSLNSEKEIDQKKIKLIKEVCCRDNYLLEVKTPEEIRQEPFFSNLKLLRRYCRVEITIRQTILCNEFFAGNSAPDLGNLIAFFEKQNEPAQAAFALLSQKILTANFHAGLIDNDLPLQLANSLLQFVNGRLAK